MKRSTQLFLIGGGVLLMISLVCVAQNTNTAETPIYAPAFGVTVVPRSFSALPVKTIPHAICSLHAEGNTDFGHTMKLFSDDEGVVRFEAKPEDESQAIAHFELDCASATQTAIFPVHLRSSFTPSPTMPAPVREGVKPKAGSFIRPSLSEHEGLRLTDEELAARMYPPRPNPLEAPEAYATWRRLVGQPAMFIPPQPMPHPDVTHTFRNRQAGTKSYTNWSGFELNGGGNTYEILFGTWVVPAVSGEATKSDYSSFWIGLDGDGTDDLVQDGTEQEVYPVYFKGLWYHFRSYYAWTQFLPQQQTEVVLTNFPVNAGDEIWSSVFMGTAQGSVQQNGQFGNFMIENVTQGTFSWTTTDRGNTPVSGVSAEWIMERPTLIDSKGNQTLADLADYGTATMNYAYAISPTAGTVYYNSAPNLNITMVNANQTDSLSSVSASTVSSMQFTWLNFN